MTQAAEHLKANLSALSVEDRAELAHYLLQTLDDEDDSDAEAAWEAELNRRMQEIESGTAVGEPVEKVMAEIRKKYENISNPSRSTP